jgi:nickel-dependent lactate racemase
VKLDIAFLHSDALVYVKPSTKKLEPLTWEMTLNPEEMFEEMISKLEDEEKEYHVLKSHLNHQTLQRTLGKKPKILVINCHGGIDHKTDATTFWFEGV